MAFQDLTTLADVKAWLKTATGIQPTTDDALLTSFLTAVDLRKPAALELGWCLSRPDLVQEAGANDRFSCRRDNPLARW
jgi:hypothetical protein